MEKESGVVSSNVGKDIRRTENDEVEKSKMTKTDPLSIKNGKREALKNDRRQDPHFLCGENCKFKAKGREIDLDVLSSGKEESADSAQLEAERRAG